MKLTLCAREVTTVILALNMYTYSKVAFVQTIHFSFLSPSEEIIM